MRTFFLIAGFVLASAAAQAGERSLSLAGGETAAVTAPAKTIDAQRTAEAPQVVEAPKYSERPPLEPKVETPKAEQPAAETAKPAPRKTASRAEKPRRTRYWTEARIVRELNRHGIYW